MSVRATGIALLIIGLAIGGAAGYMIAPKGVSQADYDALRAQVNQLETENEALRIQIAELQQGLNKTETIKIAHNVSIGYYFTDVSGYALYYYAKDVPGSGTSACGVGCPAGLTPFYVESVRTPAGLSPGDFTVINHTDGTKQLAYRGWPLYLFAQDQPSGEVRGEGYEDVMWVMKPSYTVMLAYKEGTGLYLINFTGRTLYYLAKDVPGSGRSNCTAECATKWEPFYAGRVDAPSTIEHMEFGMITGFNGSDQTTFNGWPLYIYREEAAGEIKGDAVENSYFVMKPDYTIMLAHNRVYGPYLATTSGFSLYYYNLDSPSYSMCTGSCLETFNPFYESKVTAPSILNNADFVKITRSDNIEQLAYAEWPLYTYKYDERPGETKAYGLNQNWYLLNPLNPPPSQ